MRMRALRIVPLFLGALALVFVGLVPAPASAQTPFVPYFGKNRVRYDRFDWHIYKTDHFEIYYYPELEQHLERIAAYAESAYQHISAELKHDLPGKVPMVLFKTQSEFQVQNIIPGEMPEGVLAFAEPERNRMVLPIDEPPDRLYHLIVHELTHVFEFDVIPRGLGLLTNLPLWMDEGLANYMTGTWHPIDLMQIRDAALTDNVPRMSQMESQPLSGRLPYSLGHATFEFIESKWGKEGLRSFLFSLRKSVIGGGTSAYEEALKLEAEDFDEQFDRYLKERFRAFRDKERPADYGKNLAPKADRTDYVVVLSVEPSPTGDMMATVVGNARDYELDIILQSAKDGKFITNLTKGFDKNRGYEYIATAGGMRGNLVPWISWAPVGDRIAYFARTEKDRTLIVHNVVNAKVAARYPLRGLDGPESPSFSPDGKTVAFAAMQSGFADIYLIDLETRQVTNISKDPIPDYSPAFSPDGTKITYVSRIAGNDKLFQMDRNGGNKRQITFGAHDDVGPKHLDDHTIVFMSTATDPASPIPVEVAKNGNIPNIWTLDLNTKELRQWTDALGGNVSPVVLRQDKTTRIGFVSYYKGTNGIHFVAADKPVATVASDDFGSPGPVIEFAPPQSHTLLRDNIHRKGTFEKMTLAGRPPIGLGVTSGGDIYGNTQIVFTDVLGDKQFSFFAQSVAQYRVTNFTYVNIARRMQYALMAYSSDVFQYGINSSILFDPSLDAAIANDRDLAELVQSQRGGSAFLIYPFNKYSRVEMSTGYVNVKNEYRNPQLQLLATQYQEALYGRSLFANGHMVPFNLSFVQETTVFRQYGPVSGSTMRIGFEEAPGLGTRWIGRRTLDFDVRRYMRVVANGVFAVRLRAFKSWGRDAGYLPFGGNSEMRGYNYLEFIGQKAFFANAELRFPIVEAMLTPMGVVGGLRGVVYFNIGQAGFNTVPSRFMANNAEIFTPILGYEQIDLIGTTVPIFGAPVVIRGLRLVDARASYGFGLESFILGYPMHFDWSWKTLFNEPWEDAVFAAYGGSQLFRRVKFSFWVGWDF
jgi:hypothetical protein